MLWCAICLLCFCFVFFPFRSPPLLYLIISFPFRSILLIYNPTFSPQLFTPRITAKGRTNIELREQFILADGVSQTMTAFRPKTSASSPVSGSSGSSLRTPAGPITKVFYWCTPSFPHLFQIHSHSLVTLSSAECAQIYFNVKKFK